MAPAYKVEELLALRDSVSESAVSLDKFADELVIKEVIPTTGSQGTLKRPSPSPSVKRGKAEQLLKEHGSPPGLRVTAGGRIVPGDLPPLGTRPSFNIYNPQTLRIAAGNIMAAQSQASSDATARIEIVGGQPIVVLGDRMFALPVVSNDSAMSAQTSVVNEPLPKQSTEVGAISTQGALPGLALTHSHPSQTPFEGMDLATLKNQQAVKKQELRTVEQTEVLQSGHQSETWRANMIEKKKSLIVELDTLRKQIATIESDPAVVHQTPSATPVDTVSALPPYMPSYQQPLPQPVYGYPPANPYAPVMMYPAPMGTFGTFPGPNPSPLNPLPLVHPAHSPGSTNRRSRAIEIKPPQEEPKKQVSSALDPKSPTYEPKNSPLDTVPPTPSPGKRSPWRRQETAQSESHTKRTLSHKPSLSSVDTTDFFPTNAHEHSSTRVAPSTNVSQPSQEDSKTTPATPDKSWPASPWNEGNSSRSRVIEHVPKNGSWPEAYGKPQPFSPIKPEGWSQTPAPVQIRTSQVAGSLHTTSSNDILTHDRSQQHTATDLWPLKLPTSMARLPSTFQEGFQAGYDHIGLPDSVEVLQGYIQGLLTFLSDSFNDRRSSASGRGSQAQTADSRVASLHGALAITTHRDSTISLTPGRNEALVGGQENVRAGHNIGAVGSRRDNAYSASDINRNVPAFPTGNDSTNGPRLINELSSKYSNPIGLFPENPSNGYRHPSLYPNSEQEMSKAPEKGTAPRSSSQAAHDSFGRQFFGSQLANRTNASHQPMQRFYPHQKENGPNELRRSNMSAGGPFANNRVSGLDGAMDDLADLVIETSVDSSQPHAGRANHPTTATSVEAEEPGASCFKTSGGKGKQKMSHSPIKTAMSAHDTTATSPTTTLNSPKKSGEHSPAKAKLEQVAHRFRRSKKDDPRAMSAEEKVTRSERWKKRFDTLKQSEKAEIEEYRKEESRRNGGRR
ncbi:meiotic recombination [Curvularia kusanoi]|uniref:Meiotic recombination n=1 Tax=Curvularia kusanoi TaxID=90978 RepID=A0A9P4TCP1_CURKU|nr:meiotic recombination [Curvularia kusanoi]